MPSVPITHHYTLPTTHYPQRNTGFYFVKYNERTLYMFEKMMKCGASEIGQTHSHQVLSMVCSMCSVDGMV